MKSQVKRIDGLLSVDQLNALDELIARRGYQYGWPSSRTDEIGHWNMVFSGRSKKNRDSVELSIPPVVADIWNTIRREHLPQHTVIRAYSNAYTYGTEGYIHQDSSFETDKTVLFYLNHEWKRDWAGETLFFNGDEVTDAVLPLRGRVVIFPAMTDHVARSVSRICSKDRRIVTFKVKVDQDLPLDVPDTAASLDHSGRKLRDHLRGTYDLLKKTKAPHFVCLAGGLHSVYSTNAFRKAALEIESRHLVSDQYGTDVERLVYLFCTIKRPGCLEGRNITDWRDGSKVKIADIEIEYLRLIEAANLIEQGVTIDKYPTIQATWQRYQAI